MKTSNPVRIALYLLAFTIVWILFQHAMGFNTTRHDIGQYTRMVTMIVFWVAIFVVVKNERRNRGSITFIEGWKAGLISSLIYCIGFTIFIFFYQKFINPEFYPTFKEYTLNQMQMQHATQQQIDAKMNEIDMSFNGLAISFVMLFVFSLMLGMVISAIAALVYRSKKVANPA